MLFSCDSRELARTVGVVAAAVAEDSDNFSLKAVHFVADAEDSKVRISGFDGSFGASLELRVPVTMSGSASVLAKDVLQVLRSFPVGSLQLSTFAPDPGRNKKKVAAALPNLYLLSDTIQSGVPLVDGSQFPGVKSYGDAKDFMIDSGLLQRSLAGALFPVSEDGNPALTGVCLMKSGDTFSAIGTNGSIVAHCQFQDVWGAPDFTCLVPKKGVNLLMRMLPPGSPVKVLLSNQQVYLEWEGGSFSCRLLKFPFPPVLNLFPSELPWAFQFATPEVLAGLKPLAVIAEDKDNQVRLEADTGLFEFSVGNGASRRRASSEFTPSQSTEIPPTIGVVRTDSLMAVLGGIQSGTFTLSWSAIEDTSIASRKTLVKPWVFQSAPVEGVSQTILMAVLDPRTVRL